MYLYMAYFLPSNGKLQERKMDTQNETSLFKEMRLKITEQLQKKL